MLDKEWTSRFRKVDSAFFVSRDQTGNFSVWYLFDPSYKAKTVARWDLRSEKVKVATPKAEGVSRQQLADFLDEAYYRRSHQRQMQQHEQSILTRRRKAQASSRTAEIMAKHEYLAPAMMKMIDGRPINSQDVLDGFRSAFRGDYANADS